MIDLAKSTKFATVNKPLVYVCSKGFTLTLPLSIEVYEWVLANSRLGVTLRSTKL